MSLHTRPKPDYHGLSIVPLPPRPPVPLPPTTEAELIAGWVSRKLKILSPIDLVLRDSRPQRP